MKYTATLVAVDDIARSRKLYEELLGLFVVADYSENITFEGGLSLHKREHFEMLMGGQKTVKGSKSFEIYFEEDNIEEIYEKIKQHGFEFLHDIAEQPWRQKVFRFYDYDKNIIEIGETLEHTAYRLHFKDMPIARICEITYLDEETVMNSITKYTP